MGVRRKENWPVLLEEVIKEKAEEPFKYGKHDCCLAACDCILAMTGTDVAEEFRGYRSEKGAFARLKSHGGVLGMAQYISRKFNMPSVQILKAQRGDCAVVRTKEDVYALGIIDTSGMFILSAGSPRGWKYHELSCGIEFWRV